MLENNQASPSPSQDVFDQLIQENPSDRIDIEIPELSLPEGGGSIRGIDEQFQVNAANGTASFSIAFPVTPGRHGFGPSVGISYNSGSGNGPFGLGWNLGIPAIQRRSDRKIPRYGENGSSDVFQMTGGEDLVPMLDEDGAANWQPVADQDGDFSIERFRPRVDKGNARIEKIAHPDHGVWWRVISPSGITTIYGRDETARIADPKDDTRIFKWLPEFSFDQKGNWTLYTWKAEDGVNVPHEIYERNRKNGYAAFTNRYLKRIQYGNHVPYLPDPASPWYSPLPSDMAFHYELVFDYGEHDPDQPTAAPTPGMDWAYRSDAFSSYRSGFEIRTQRLCRRILQFHHFPGEENPGVAGEDFGSDYLVRSLELNYTPSSINGSGQAEVTYLTSAQLNGYIRKDDGSYSSKSLPAATYGYQTLEWDQTVQDVDSESLENVPSGLNGGYLFVDLFGEGISGLLREEGDAWYYKSNYGRGENPPNLHLGASIRLPSIPSMRGLDKPTALSIQSLEGDGRKELVVNREGLQGYYPLDHEDQWQGFTPMETALRLDLAQSHQRLLDLTGDGKLELVVTEERAIVWYASKGRQGYAAPEATPQPHEEEAGPAILFSDREQCIFLADMTGDGLTDIVRIRNGEVGYWANCGYGNFSAKVTLGNTEAFDHSDQFDPARIRLADISGTGTSDIIYLGQDTLSAYLNLSGNALSDVHPIRAAFPQNQLSSVTVTDLLGTGTACVVWSSSGLADAGRQFRYIDLMAGKKPHLLNNFNNASGKEISLEFTPSTTFYLRDKIAGTPWVTRLPFPVQVVSQVESREHISQTRLTTTYTYHHGYYDAAEREFRGFGRVEKTDSEAYTVWAENEAALPESAEETFQQPVLTKTWYHTGALLQRESLLEQFQQETWDKLYNEAFPDTPVVLSEPGFPDMELVASPGVEDPQILTDLSATAWREALRACRGTILREEVFALDAPEESPSESARQLEAKPYSVKVNKHLIHILQPDQEGNHAVFRALSGESISLWYERDETDPRTSHHLNIEQDEWGNELLGIDVMYARASPDLSLPAETQDAQGTIRILATQRSYTQEVSSDLLWRIPVSCGMDTWELSSIPQSGGLYNVSDFQDILTTATTEIDYQTPPSGAPERRLIESSRTLFLHSDLENSLAYGTQGERGLVYESYQLAFDPAMLTALFGPKIPDPDTTLPDGDYVHFEGDVNWWVPSGKMLYLDFGAGELPADAEARFFNPVGYEDASGSVTTVSYYGDYFMMQSRSENAVGNAIEADSFDFRTLGATRLRDTNDNLTELVMDELGAVKASALLGKDLDRDGTPELELCDSLTGITAISEAEEATVNAFFAETDPATILTLAETLLGQATVRFVYQLSPDPTQEIPLAIATIYREQHHASLGAGQSSRLQLTMIYLDGNGKTVLTKKAAESDGPAPYRWLGSGRTVLNNKGNPVRQYEPYFTAGPGYDQAEDLVQQGVTRVMFYDPLSRIVQTDNPDGTFTTVGFTPWHLTFRDANDNAGLSDWYTNRIGRLIDVELMAEGKDPAKEAEAAVKTEPHHDTPLIQHLDVLGNPVLAVAHNRDLAGLDEFHFTHVVRDIEGNVQSVVDPRGNTPEAYRYDYLGRRRVHQNMDTGTRWSLVNAMGSPYFRWDSRGHRFEMTYDPLQRPLEMKVTGGDGPAPLDHTYGRMVYGEGQTDDRTLNLRGNIFRRYDTAGLIDYDSYDLKGNLTVSHRTFATDFKSVPNWPASEVDAALLLERESFATTQSYDALDRAVEATTADGSTQMAEFNPRGLLSSVTVEQGSGPEDYVQQIRYDARGQRQSITYGSGVHTTYRYDALNFRLLNMRSQTSGGDLLQDLSYTTDAVGNLTTLEDRAIPTVFFGNHVVEPVSLYSYDALYRLIQAEGREHIGQIVHSGADNWEDLPFLVSHAPGNAMAWREYTEFYQYDLGGNIEQMRHVATGGSWTRDYQYEAPTNRLVSTQVGAQAYNYPHHPDHGYLMDLPHLTVMDWNFQNELKASSRQSVGSGTPETTWYVYNFEGKRVRKITENEAAEDVTPSRKSERMYLGNAEIYREYTGANAGLERTSLHVSDDGGRIALTERRNGVNDGSPVKTIRYQMSNLQGSAILETDEFGAVVSYEEHHPFGTTAYLATNSALAPAAKRYRYNGKERDDETGLYYYGARYYLPWLARWLKPDPIGLRGGPNVYAYVSNNPINKIDPTGWDEITIYHRTTADAASSMMEGGVQVSRSGNAASAAWAGRGFYAGGSPDIPDEVIRRGGRDPAVYDTIIEQRISTDNMVTLEPTRSGSSPVDEFIAAQRDDYVGRTARSQISRQRGVQSPGDRYLPEADQLRDRMGRRLDQLAPGADVVRWQNADGGFTYIVRDQSAIRGRPHIARSLGRGGGGDGDGGGRGGGGDTDGGGRPSGGGDGGGSTPGGSDGPSTSRRLADAGETASGGRRLLRGVGHIAPGALSVLSYGLVTADVAMAETPEEREVVVARAAGGEAGGEVGFWAGCGGFALLFSETGPGAGVACIVGGIIVGFGGGMAGEELGEATLDAAREAPSTGSHRYDPQRDDPTNCTTIMMGGGMRTICY